jgi:uncharacterized RDD family membrane protein YckC
MIGNYPTLAQRYFATTLDVFVVISLTITLVKILEANSPETGPLWYLVFIPAVFYEPVLTSKFATIGQAVFKFRIREASSGEKIGILKAYARLLIKFILGIISLFTIPNNKQRQAIHDKAVSTLAVKIPFR